MSTAGQVVSLYGASPETATGPAERAPVARPPLPTRAPLQWWWGDPGSAIASGAPKQAAASSGPSAPGAPAGSPSGGCCG